MARATRPSVCSLLTGRRSFIPTCCFLAVFMLPGISHAQDADSTAGIDPKSVILKEVVVRSNLNVPAFIRRVENDTSFYKAFRNLRILGYSSLNNIWIFDKKGRTRASLSSRSIQKVAGRCRWTNTLEEKTTGDFYNRHHEYNYYTADMYAGLFFARDTICGETNIVANHAFSTQGKSGMSKHKEQLKMLFFNPGKRIPGLPFIANKVALFDEDVAKLYDFEIDMEALNGEMCYVFRIRPRADLSESEKNQVVINSMITWFRISNWDIVARTYDLSYRAGVYDFDVHMEAEMTNYKGYLVPHILRYNGNWDVVFKKRERASFTATLFDFTE